MAKLGDDYLFEMIKQEGEPLGEGAEKRDCGEAFDDDEIQRLVAFIGVSAKGNRRELWRRFLTSQSRNPEIFFLVALKYGF